MTAFILPTHECAGCGRRWALRTRSESFGEPCPDCGEVVLRADLVRAVRASARSTAGADPAVLIDHALDARRRRLRAWCQAASSARLARLRIVQ